MNLFDELEPPTNSQVKGSATLHTIAWPMLYAKGTTGKVLEWQIEVYAHMYRTTTGFQGMKKVVSEYTECEGKNIGRSNETSPHEQARLEAQALWEKKIKSKGYWENIDNIHKTKFIKPMLALKLSDFRDKVDPTDGLIVQIKYNGLCGLLNQEGMRSRTGEPYLSVPHIEGSFEGFFDEFPLAVLHGEMFNWELREKLNEIVKLCRKTKNIEAADLFASEKLVKYYVYDGYGFGAKENDPYTRRKQVIDEVLPKWSQYVEHVVDHVIHSWEELDELYALYVGLKQEGVMVRIPNHPYEHKRSNYLLKCKPTDDDEFTISLVEEGKGNWSGKAKRIGLLMDVCPDPIFRAKYGFDFCAAFKGTMPEAEKMLIEKDDYIGQRVKIFYNGFTGLGTPNFAQFNIHNWKIGDK